MFRCYAKSALGFHGAWEPSPEFPLPLLEKTGFNIALSIDHVIPGPRLSCLRNVATMAVCVLKE